jgi:hypothetical protein
MKALKARQVWAIVIGLSLGLGARSIAVAQIVKDPPWNPDHIDHLPAEVRSAVVAKCGKLPSAGHYFATYSQNARQITVICTSSISIASKVRPFAVRAAVFTKYMR